MTKPYRIVIDERSTTQDLTTVDSVKLDLGLDPLDTEQDEWIAAQIKQASSAIASMCNRAFGAETLSNYFNVGWCYGGPLELSRIPVTEIVSVTEGSSALAADHYELDEESGLLWRASGTGLWRGNWLSGACHVQFIAGYQLLTTLPYDLERAANMLIKRNHYGKTRDPSVRSESIPGVMSVDYSSGAATASNIEGTELGVLLAPYKLPAYG